MGLCASVRLDSKQRYQGVVYKCGGNSACLVVSFLKKSLLSELQSNPRIAHLKTFVSFCKMPVGDVGCVTSSLLYKGSLDKFLLEHGARKDFSFQPDSKVIVQ